MHKNQEIIEHDFDTTKIMLYYFFTEKLTFRQTLNSSLHDKTGWNFQ